MSSSDLLTAQLELTGRITTASNATFLGNIGNSKVVYKPIAGEQPLWDFPHGTLASREIAAYLVSEPLGWNLVPRTWLRDGRFGEGMVQLWQDTDPAQHPVDIIPTSSLPTAGLLRVLDGQDEAGQQMSLVHEDTVALRRMAVFDALVNNADRKGDHVLAMADGHRFGVDHGLSFNEEHKLRTVLWGWIGQSLSEDELAGIARVIDALGAELGAQLAELLTAEEIAAFSRRCQSLADDAHFPAHHGQMPAVPWPLF
ncbi:SCO1664 family protein [Glutamicibacter arilaitensis]|uniref:SCO1664 family protein n=1 Tax=Glutamicibacter arilaitensis TaxID=256701 RepID=A0A4Y8TWW6_9MICC|nr:SCO1664 family protein [Glutamicibacter arilaitensis]TFH56665.1 SCO1664 family protein [Glutamicibacter arilaitensis]